MNEMAVDTDVFSFVFKGDTRAHVFRPLLNAANPCLCFVSVAELYRWAIMRNWSARKLADLKREIGSYRILHYDDDTAWQWANIMSVAGKPLAANDAWIAASALRHGMPLLTNNRKHYQQVTGLTLLP